MVSPGAMLRAMENCLACDLASGRLPLPGGLIHRTGGWLVEHCVGPLGLGTLIVKPGRHVTAVADLTQGEAAERPDDGQVAVAADRARALFGGGAAPRRVGT